MNCPLVSVLITAFNRERYIKDAIESVLAQTFSDFEIVIVDDCSTDRTFPLANEYAEKYSKIRLYRNEKNLGDYPNRNHAAELATGTYLKYVDSDDLLYSHGLRVMVESMKRFPDAALGLCREPSETIPFPVQLSSEEAYKEGYFGAGLFSNAPLSTIIRTDVFRKVGGFSGKPYVGDTELWLTLAARCAVVKMVKGLTFWRSHGDQEFTYEKTSIYASVERYLIHMNALNSVNCPLSNSDRKKAKKIIKHRHARQIIRGFTVHPISAFRLMANTHFGFIDVLRYFFP